MSRSLGQHLVFAQEEKYEAVFKCRTSPLDVNHLDAIEQIELLPWPSSDRADANHLLLCRPIQRRRAFYWFLPVLLDCFSRE